MSTVRVLINTALTVPPSRIVLNNQEYLTAPAVLVVAGVLNGGLVAGEELHAEDWNGVAVTVGHPMDPIGTPLSARQPSVIAACGVGRVYHARLSTGQRNGQRVPSLQAELWINLAEAQACGQEAMQAVQMLEAQEPLEISTAFYCESERAAGSAYGTPYTEIHRDLRPDHLALLPNSVGACSWESGCGAPRLNHQGGRGITCACDTCQGSPMDSLTPRGWQAFVAMLKQFVQREDATPPPVTLPAHESETAPDAHAALAVNATDQDIRESLYGALAREMGQDFTPIYIDAIDTANQSFTYRQGERLRMRSWQMEGDVLTLADDAQDVQRDTRYVPVEGVPVTQQQQEEAPLMTTPQSSPVAIKARVNALIVDTLSHWKERDRPILEGFSEAALIRLEQQPKLVPIPEAPAPRTFGEILAEADPGVRESIEEAMDELATRKQAAIAVLVANKACPFTTEELTTMTAKRLEQLVAMAAQSDYIGKGLPPERVVPKVLEAPPAPPDVLGGALKRQKELGMRV